MTRVVIGLSLLLVLWASGGCGSRGLSETERKAVKEHYDKGVEYMLVPFYVNEPLLRKALTEFQQCLQINPNHLWARFALGMTYLKLGEFPTARDELMVVAKREDGKDLDLRYSAGPARWSL